MKWQPIATAPEGEMVLVWADKLNRGLPSAEVVMIFNEGYGPDPANWCYWTNGGPNAGDDICFESPPTHWMPLPPPPNPS
jgi:hypothetical protein